jgi:hypothetical protein
MSQINQTIDTNGNLEDSSTSGSNTTNLDENVENIDTKLLWDKIGFHRPLAGFWNKMIYEIGILIIPMVIGVQLIKFLYPFPESRGYSGAITGIFVLIFTIFDLGTSSTINRFIADENIKNPVRMVQYIQYYVWYQAITGLIQVTGISIWAIFYARDSQLAYGVWIMLVVSIKQWPGFPGVFKGVLNALQMYDKKNAIEFIQGEGIQILTEILFVVLGKWYGQNNPEIGELLGIAIGATFGLYLDDVIASFIAAYVLSKGLQPFGITFRTLFEPGFDWEIVKECTLFGIKMGFPGLFSASIQLYALSLMLNFVPQYTTFAALAGMALSLVALVDRLVYQDFTPIFTEAYQNGKKKLCQYYNAHAIRFFFINSGFTVSIILSVISVFDIIFEGMGLTFYMLTIPFLIPSLIKRLLSPYIKYPGNILIAAHRPNQLMIMNLIFESLRFLVWFLTIQVFRIQALGIGGVVYVLVLTEIPLELIKIVVYMIYVDRTIFKLKFMFWQTFIVPILATIILYCIFSLFKIYLLDKMWAWSFFGTLIIGFILILFIVSTLYFPLTVVLGGVGRQFHPRFTQSDKNEWS